MSEPTPPSAVRPILETLRELRRGAMLDEASEKLNELVLAVTERRRPGQLRITLDVKPGGKGAVVTHVIIDDSVTLKLPEPVRDSTVFFPTGDGNLSRNDQSQLDLGLRAVQPRETAADVRQPAAS